MPSSDNPRAADHPINPVFLERWSPRAFDGHPVPREDLMAILEAARWAPSSYNQQPWRFVYAIKDGPHWTEFLDLLVEANRAWCRDAGALLVLLSKTTQARPDGSEVPSYSHSHDAGCAWGYLALQATMMGYAAHGMVGFDHERAPRALGVPPSYRIEQMIALGRRGDPAKLPESVRAREQPNTRRPLTESVAKGTFQFS
jgi:nitroreductase